MSTANFAISVDLSSRLSDSDRVIGKVYLRPYGTQNWEEGWYDLQDTDSHGIHGIVTTKDSTYKLLSFSYTERTMQILLVHGGSSSPPFYVEAIDID